MNSVVNYLLRRDPDDWIRNGYSKWTHDGYSLGKGGVEVESFIKARRLILGQEVKNGKIKSGDLNTIKLNIHFGSQTAEYTHPSTGEKESIELTDITDKDTLDAINDYYEKANGKMWQRGLSITGNSKGNRAGKAPLSKKKDSALMSLPGLEHTIKEQLPQLLATIPPDNAPLRNVISRRLLFVEYYHQKMTEKTKVRLTGRQQALGSAATDADKKAIQSEIAELKRLEVQLQKLDFYALAKVLTATPVGPVWSSDRDKIAEALLKQVEADIFAQSGFMSKLISKVKTPELTPEQRAYALDMAGMVYLNRKQYFAFCDKHKLPKKNEGIADVFLREAIKFADTPAGTDYLAEGFKNSALIDRFGESAKQMAADDFGSTGVVASHAIPHYNYAGGIPYLKSPIEYPDKATDAQKKEIDEQNKQIEQFNKEIENHPIEHINYPNGATDDQKKAIDEQNKQIDGQNKKIQEYINDIDLRNAKGNFDAHRQSINQKMVLKDVPEPAVPSIAESSVRVGDIIPVPIPKRIANIPLPIATLASAAVVAASEILPRIASSSLVNTPISTLAAPVVNAVEPVISRVSSWLTPKLPPVCPVPAPPPASILVDALKAPVSVAPTVPIILSSGRGPVIEMCSPGDDLGLPEISASTMSPVNSPSTLGTMAESAAKMVPASISGAVNHLRLWATQNPEKLILGLFGIEWLARRGYNFIRPLKRQPDGTPKREFSKTNAAIAATALYLGYQMYRASTDGVVDGSWAEWGGDLVSRAITPVANATTYLAKHVWDNTTVFSIKPGVTIPFVGYRLWDGNIPYYWGGFNYFKIPIIPIGAALLAKPITGIARAVTGAIARRINNPVAKKAAEGVESVATAADQAATSILAAKTGIPMALNAVSLAEGILPSLGYLGKKGVQVLSAIMPSDPMMIPRQLMSGLSFGRSKGIFSNLF